MIKYSISPLAAISSLIENHELIFALIKREFVGKYKGSLMGWSWSIINPLLMLVVYTFVFSVVFKARWGAQEGSKVEFALVLFSGLIAFNFFVDCVSRAPSIITSNTNYVKKVIFPLDCLAFVNVCAAFLQALISCVVWCLAYFLLLGIPSWTIILAPLVFIPLFFMCLGLSWCLSSLGVYVRDIQQVVVFFTTSAMFMTPIFYPITALPIEYQYLLHFNPLTHVVEMMRDVMYWGKVPLLGDYFSILLYTIIFSVIGFVWFQKTRKGFADVL
jgi:lipopolysaccharide transport system permease protein